MEQLRLGLKRWIKSVLKPIMLWEMLDDIKKLFIRVWNLRFSITLLVMFCMILQLHIAVGRINIRIGNKSDILVRTGQLKVIKFSYFLFLASWPRDSQTAGDNLRTGDRNRKC